MTWTYWNKLTPMEKLRIISLAVGIGLIAVHVGIWIYYGMPLEFQGYR
jgi:hypothetical protein